MWYFRYQKIETGKWFDCDASGRDIKNDRLSCMGEGILPSDYETWKAAIVEWINENNRKIFEGDLSGYEITYKMIDVDEDYAYTYEKYVNGHLAKEGKGWFKDLITEQEQEAWRKAVKEYKKSQNIKTESEKRKEKKERTRKKIKEEDEKLPQEMPLTPPTLVSAIDKAQSEPCEFMTEIMQKGIQGVTGMSPKEIVNYYTKLAKYNLHVTKTQLIEGTTGLIEQLYYPVEDSIDKMDEYFADLDTEREEWLKQHSDDVCLLDMVLAEKPIIAAQDQETYVFNEGKFSKGTFEWHNKGPNEEIITQPRKLWSIVRKDLGAVPTESQTKKSMTVIEVPTKDKNGVIHMRKVTVHKAAAGTIKAIFDELSKLSTEEFYIEQRCYHPGNKAEDPNEIVNGYQFRRASKAGGGFSTNLSNHSFGIAFDINRYNNPQIKAQPGYNIKENDDSLNTNVCMRTFNHPAVKILNKYGFGWGGAYNDYMHFSCKTETRVIKNKNVLKG
jgi:hypothetical protein